MNLNHIAKKPFFDLFYRTPCMPAMMRAALYDATLMNQNGSARGASGTVFLANQLAIAQSKELSFVVKQVEEIQKTGNHITHTLSRADLLQLGGYAAVEYCGGPAMIFEMGRYQVQDEGDTIQHSAESHAGSLVTQGLLAQKNLAPEEFVALMGSFTLGFCGEEKKGYHTRWCMNPYVFDNTYFQELMLLDKSKYFRTESDMKLMQNDSLKSWVTKYAEDQDLFFHNYAKAHVKISELGQQENLMSEFEGQVDGGYQERNKFPSFITEIRNLYNAAITQQPLEEVEQQDEASKLVEQEHAKQLEAK